MSGVRRRRIADQDRRLPAVSMGRIKEYVNTAEKDVASLDLSGFRRFRAHRSE